MDHTRHSITADELLPWLGTAKAPHLIDVSLPEDVSASPWRLPTALHIPHSAIQDWGAMQEPDIQIVTICQKGLKLSHGAAALLRGMGFAARALEGGNSAWCAADYPRVAVQNMLDHGTRWVLPATLDAQACVTAWLVMRWFDANATLLWVPPEHVKDVAQRFEGRTLPKAPLSQSLGSTGLVHLDLIEFVVTLDTITSPVIPLLQMLPNLHERDEDLVRAALPFLDTAWLLHRNVGRQETK